MATDSFQDGGEALKSTLDVHQKINDRVIRIRSIALSKVLQLVNDPSQDGGETLCSIDDVLDEIC